VETVVFVNERIGASQQEPSFEKLRQRMKNDVDDDDDDSGDDDSLHLT